MTLMTVVAACLSGHLMCTHRVIDGELYFTVLERAGYVQSQSPWLDEWVVTRNGVTVHVRHGIKGTL